MNEHIVIYSGLNLRKGSLFPLKPCNLCSSCCLFWIVGWTPHSNVLYYMFNWSKTACHLWTCLWRMKIHENMINDSIVTGLENAENSVHNTISNDVAWRHLQIDHIHMQALHLINFQELHPRLNISGIWQWSLESLSSLTYLLRQPARKPFLSCSKKSTTSHQQGYANAELATYLLMWVLHW